MRDEHPARRDEAAITVEMERIEQTLFDKDNSLREGFSQLSLEHRVELIGGETGQQYLKLGLMKRLLAEDYPAR